MIGASSQAFGPTLASLLLQQNGNLPYYGAQHTGDYPAALANG